jgi:hypothetical protein
MNIARGSKTYFQTQNLQKSPMSAIGFTPKPPARLKKPCGCFSTDLLSLLKKYSGGIGHN